ncbi:MAG: hypothetical protein ACT4PO_00990 [Actinomycetota bacterium]
MSRRRVPHDPNVVTVYLGQFTREGANRIAGELEKAGIVWWYKEPGLISQIWEYGVRLFVDRNRLADAKSIVDRLRTKSESPGG